MSWVLFACLGGSCFTYLGFEAPSDENDNLSKQNQELLWQSVKILYNSYFYDNICSVIVLLT